MNDLTLKNESAAIPKTSQLRRLLRSSELEFIMEAHNGISARIVEEAGFKGIWASGLALSAQYGVRDNNEASWTQIVEMLEFMSDVTTIPILLDGDTGYGNFNNMRRLVRKLEQRKIAGVCIEDKQFPKTNSFIDSERQPLADIDEFCGKIKAGKDSVEDDEFSIVARVEALIAGWGQDEALRRAEAYAEAGADAILIHSKRSQPDEVLAFAQEWGERLPVVIVPTKYYSTPADVYRKAGISLVIWANQLIRAAASSMQSVARSIRESESPIDVENQLATVGEIFRLQGAEELQVAEKRYHNAAHTATRAIVLAASRGNEFAELTDERPKVMLPIGGKPLLRRLVDEFKRQQINDVVVVAGYKAESINMVVPRIVVNEDYESGGELKSLACARQDFGDDMVIIYGDLLFRSYVLNDLLASPGDIVVVVDSAISEEPVTGVPDYAYCNARDDRSVFDQDVELLRITRETDPRLGKPCGRWIGMMRVKDKGRQYVEDALESLMGATEQADYAISDLLNYLVAQGHQIKVRYIQGHWLDVNSLADLERAGNFTSGDNQDR